MAAKMSKEHAMIPGLVMLIIGLLALAEVMGWVTILGFMGLPWLYVMLIFMGLKMLMHSKMCK